MREFRAADASLFGHDAQGAGRDDEMDASNASVVLESPQHFNGEDGAAGAGYGENEG
jgi:hypothetical protein